MKDTHHIQLQGKDIAFKKWHSDSKEIPCALYENKA